MSATSQRTSSPAVASVGVETQGIAPVPADRRYGRPARLFSLWFAPNLNVTVIFTGALSITIGLDFVSAVFAIIVGTVAGAAVSAYLGTWGPRTGSGQLPFARLPFGRAVVAPGALNWLTAVAWDSLVNIFGGQAVQTLTGLPFWLGVVIVLALQAVIGFFGYELIHRVQIIISCLLAIAFVILTVRIFTTAHLVLASSAHGADKTGSWFLVVAICFSLSISWAPFASDFSRYMPAGSSAPRMFFFATAGMSLSFFWGLILGAAGAQELTDQTAAGISKLMGGGALGVIALLTIVVSSVSSNAMNDYSGSLSLQTVGIRIPRPIAALVVAAFALALSLWMTGNLASRFENVLLLTSYWIPCFVAVVVIDWTRRPKEADGTVDVDAALRHRHSGWPALVAMVAGCASTLLFMNTTLWVGPVATLLHGADLAYYVAFIVSGAVYAALLLIAGKSAEPLATATADLSPAG
jgi:NCS1 family nucleobase:cation symporter-1